jgi:hypothetical protein
VIERVFHFRFPIVIEMLDQINEDILIEAAQLLGISKKNQIELEKEEYQDYLFDFALNEVVNHKQKLAETYKEKNPNIEEAKQVILDTLIASYTSLFKIISTSPDSGTLELQDILNPNNKPIILTDINFSKTATNHHLLFTRIVHFDQLTISSGASFVFHCNHELYILKKYRKLLKKINVENDSTKRFIAFFQLSNEMKMVIEL